MRTQNTSCLRSESNRQSIFFWHTHWTFPKWTSHNRIFIEKQLQMVLCIDGQRCWKQKEWYYASDFQNRGSYWASAIFILQSVFRQVELTFQLFHVTLHLYWTTLHPSNLLVISEHIKSYIFFLFLQPFIHNYFFLTHVFDLLYFTLYLLQ